MESFGWRFANEPINLCFWLVTMYIIDALYILSTISTIAFPYHILACIISDLTLEL